ncbi:uncharacterized protein LOC127102411 [Lathyrus oleraceus]|uniref:uncharacterized protein LOC127102411 n=1 Tax=Pisum sativum TaxID=3888 RepID=UPI0021CF238D|nr:uncharacterized protein LOC127102411 [Pisum sativum]
MVHPYMFPKDTMRMDIKADEVKNYVKPDEVKDDVKLGARLIVIEVDVLEPFANKYEFIVHKHKLQWVHMEAGKLGFSIVIERSNNSSNRRQAFVTMRCKRSDTYQPPIRKLKRDDTGSRKGECPFKLCGYCKADDTLKLYVVYGTHNHALYHMLVGHPIVCLHIPEEKELVSNMTLNMVAPKNILATLKRERPQNVSIKQVYNVCA